MQLIRCMKRIEVLMSTTKIKSRDEIERKIKDANIITNLSIVNQIEKKGKESIIKINESQKMYNLKESGTSKSRNKLLEVTNKDICIFADDDIKYVEKYDEIILEKYRKYPKADGILFYVENTNANREKNKKIGNRKLRFLDIMKARIYELSLTKEAVQKIKKNNIKFDCNFGPGGIFFKGEDTIFLSDLLKINLDLRCVNVRIGTVGDTKSSWFKGVNEKYLYDQGAIFYKIAPKMYKVLILQYVIRKYSLYKKKVTIKEAYIEMKKGANFAKRLYNANIDFDVEI